MNCLSVALGGAIGALLRYAASGLLRMASAGTFPWGTMFVNLSGSFLIGALWGACEHAPLPELSRLFLFTGILGAYTTFSTFALENINLLRVGRMDLAIINIIVSNLAGIILAFAGYALVRSLWAYLLAR